MALFRMLRVWQSDRVIYVQPERVDVIESGPDPGSSVVAQGGTEYLVEGTAEEVASRLEGRK